MLGETGDATLSERGGSLEDSFRELCQRYQAGDLTAAAAMAQIAELLQITLPAAEADLPLVDEANLSNGYRFYRTEHKGSGWQALFALEGKRYHKYFPDSIYGSAEASRKAAEEFASQNRELHEELWALRSRFLVRKNSRSGIPGVSRYDGNERRGPYWLAYWADPKTGRRVSKRFPIGEHGESEALNLAIKTRERAIEPCRQRYGEILLLLGLTDERSFDPEAGG
jgi:hypothetical protein